MKHIVTASFLTLVGLIALVNFGVLENPLAQPTDQTHPAGYNTTTDEVHVHSDLLIYLDGTYIDLSEEKYQTTREQTIHPDIHLHDNTGHIIHRHEHAITLVEFLASLGFTLTSECITTDTGDAYCSDEHSQLAVYVNGALLPDPTTYINDERHQILIYYDDNDAPESIIRLLSEVTDESCIYSGTCPERGVAPPESCGLTCEL